MELGERTLKDVVNICSEALEPTLLNHSDVENITRDLFCSLRNLHKGGVYYHCDIKLELGNFRCRAESHRPRQIGAPPRRHHAIYLTSAPRLSIG